jgi:hypothetical protein
VEFALLLAKCTPTPTPLLTQGKDFLALLRGNEPPMSCKILSHTTITVNDVAKSTTATKIFVKVTALDHEKTLTCIQKNPGKVARPSAAVACRWPLLDVLGRGKTETELITRPWCLHLCF